MPNWCDNYIEITGTKENMKPLYDFFTSGDNDQLVMGTLIPHDEEYAEIEKRGDFLLNPQTTFYGTKWDFELVDIIENGINEEDVTFSVPTAWSPPLEFCEKLAKRYGITVTISFDEQGVGLIGKAVYYADGTSDITDYDDYMEGLYEVDNERFWTEVEYQMEYWKKEEELSFENLKENLFSFLTDESELKELETLYNEEY